MRVNVHVLGIWKERARPKVWVGHFRTDLNGLLDLYRKPPGLDEIGNGSVFR
jgi:hypothetical protein